MSKYTQHSRSHLQHTVFCTYLVWACAIFAVLYESNQRIIDKFSVSKKWYYLYGTVAVYL